MATLEPLYGHIEDLHLPGGFWSLTAEIAWGPIDFKRFTKRRDLTVPPAAILGAAARPRHKPWSMDGDGERDFNGYSRSLVNSSQRVDDPGEPKENGPVVPTHSPMDVLPKTLQRLTIFEADETVCQWIEDIFCYKGESFKELVAVLLVITDTGL